MITTTKSQSDLLALLGATGESELRQIALLAVAEAYTHPSADRETTRRQLVRDARPIFRRMVKERYGSIIVIGIILVAAVLALETAFEWAVTRILDWLWPEHDPPNGLRIAHIVEMQTKSRAGL